MPLRDPRVDGLQRRRFTGAGDQKRAVVAIAGNPGQRLVRDGGVPQQVIVVADRMPIVGQITDVVPRRREDDVNPRLFHQTRRLVVIEQLHFVRAG